jgi:cell division protein FtsQ
VPITSARPTILVPRERRGTPVDAATREPFIAHQQHRSRRLRRVRRSVRWLGTVVAAGLISTAIAVAVVAVVHAIRQSRLMAVSDVAVVGVRRLSETAIRTAAAIEPDASLLDLDVAAVRGRLEAMPGVRRARVVRHLPNRVALWIEEREPYTLVNLDRANRSGLVWIDADGYLVGPERRGTTPSLPILSGVEAPATSGEPLGDRLQAGLTLLRAIQRSGTRVVARISEIDLEPAGGPVLYTVDGAAVWLGAEGWDERLARLDGVLGELDDHHERVDSLDLRFRDLVVLKPRPSPTTTMPKER